MECWGVWGALSDIPPLETPSLKKPEATPTKTRSSSFRKCQRVGSLSDGPLLGTLNKRGRRLVRTPKGPILERSDHMAISHMVLYQHGVLGLGP